jgi:preprotein translocase subunit SecG
MPTVITKEIPAGSTRINCPACGSLDIPAEILERQETMMQSMVIPIGTHTTWWVVCSACQAKLYSKLNAAGLQGKSSDELVGQVYPYVSFVNQFLAVAALLLSPAPGLGTILGLIAWLVNRKTSGWPRKLSKFAVFASLFFIVALLVLAVITAPRHR